MTKKAQPANVPMLTGEHRTPMDMVQCGTTHYNALSTSTEWSDAALHAPADEWKQTTDDLAANHQKLEDLLKQVAAARAQEVLLMRKWSSGARGTLAAVDKHCASDGDKVKACGFTSGKHPPRPPAATPTKLLPKNVQQHGDVGVQWTSDGYEHDYQVQWATNPADSATYSALALVSRRKFVLTGQAVGATLYFRVRALDAKLTTGATDWTPWLPVMVR